MAKNYCGDVEVTVKMRYRLDADFPTQKPTAAQVLKCLRACSYNDIMDEEKLEIVSVEKVGKSFVGSPD